jgi:hypothetical protein
MTALYKHSKDSQHLNNTFLNKSISSTIHDCKSFHSGFTIIENSLFRRDRNLSELATRIKTKTLQYKLHTVTIEWLYKSFEEKICKKTLIKGCNELVENKKWKSEKVQVGKFKHKYVYTILPEEVTGNYFFYDNQILNNNNLSHNAFLIAGYLQSHDESFYHNLTLEKIGYDTGIRKNPKGNKITITNALNELLECQAINRKIIREINNGKKVNKTIYIINKNYSIVDNSVDKYVDNFSNEAEIKKSTSAQNYTIYNSTPNKDKNIIKKKEKEKNFKKVLNKSIKVSDAIADVNNDLQLEVTKNEVFDPLVELESDNIREAVIVDKDILDNALWVNRPYTLANLCNPFSKNGALNPSVAFTIKKLSGREFSYPELHKLICNIQIRYLNKHEKLPVYSNLNNLIVSVIEMIKKEKRKVDDIRTYDNWMPQDLRNAIARSKYEFTEYQIEW